MIPSLNLRIKSRSYCRISSTSSSVRLLFGWRTSRGVSEVRLVASTRAMAGGFTNSLEYDRNNRAGLESGDPLVRSGPCIIRTSFTPLTSRRSWTHFTCQRSRVGPLRNIPKRSSRPNHVVPLVVLKSVRDKVCLKKDCLARKLSNTARDIFLVTFASQSSP